MQLWRPKRRDVKRQTRGRNKGSRIVREIQLDSELTLEKAKKAIRQKEAVKEQRKQLQGDGPEVHPSLEEVRYNRSLALPDSTRKYSEKESGDTSIPNQFFWNVRGRGHVNRYCSRGRDTVPEGAAVDAAKELGYDSLKDLQLAVIRGIVSWQECTHFPLFQKCE